MTRFGHDCPLRLGTRASPLALRQAEMAKAALLAAHGWPEEAVALVPMVASGDRIQDRALADVGGKALWTKELDRALVDGDVHACVHSMKDVETFRPVAFALAAMLPRADVRDRLIGAPSLAQVPHGARVGTSSPRRTAQLLARRPDLQILLLRGNVATRLAKLDAAEADVTLLAAAGLDRLGLPDIGQPLDVEDMLPAPAQGAVGIEVLADNADVRSVVDAIDHPLTSMAVRLERALLAALGADCRSPVAALARPAEGGAYMLRVQLLSLDGQAQVQGEETVMDEMDAAEFGRKLLAAAPAAVRALFAG